MRNLLRLSDGAAESGQVGDGGGDDFGSTVDVGCHASRFGSGKATVVGAQTQLALVRVDDESGWPPSWHGCRRASRAVVRWWTVARQG